MLALLAKTPLPEGLPSENIINTYFLQALDTPFFIWAIRIVLVLCVTAFLVGIWIYSTRDKKSEHDAQEQNKEDIK